MLSTSKGEANSSDIPTPVTEEQIMKAANGLTQQQISGKVVLLDYDPARPAHLKTPFF